MVQDIAFQTEEDILHTLKRIADALEINNDLAGVQADLAKAMKEKLRIKSFNEGGKDERTDR